MQVWQRFGIGAAALLLAVAAGTGAYAMRDDDGPAEQAAADTDISSREVDGGGSVAAMCVEGVPDCDDMIVLPGDDPVCDESGVCSFPGAPPNCALDAACEPLPVDPGCTVEECYGDVEKCEDLARRGELVLCAPPDPRCIEPAPDAVAEETVVPLTEQELERLCPPLEDPCVADDSCAPYMCVEPMPLPVEEEPAVPEEGAEPLPPDVVPCPPVDCGEPRPLPPVNDGDVETLPAPDCRLAPSPCDDPNERCLPPDCAISSDGIVWCPEPSSEPPQGGGGQSQPGSPGVVDPAPEPQGPLEE